MLAREGKDSSGKNAQGGEIFGLTRERFGDLGGEARRWAVAQKTLEAGRGRRSKGNTPKGETKHGKT